MTLDRFAPYRLAPYRPAISGLVFTAIAAYCLPLSAAPEVPGKPQTRPVALIGATVHPVSGPAIENGVLVFDRGEIVAVGNAKTKIPENAERLDLQGKHVYPGLFDAYTNMGLVEINAVRATRDEAETGRINPNASARVAVNPDSELIPVTRSNGVLLTLTAPSGSLLAGRSSVLQLDGWTYEDMTLQSDVALHIVWPRMSAVADAAKKGAQQGNSRDKAVEQLRQAFDDARAYRLARQADEDYPLDARWESMLPVLDGALPLLVVADESQQIQAAVAFAEQQKCRMILYGGYDAPRQAELLKQHDVPVIVGGVYRLPERRDDAYDAAYTVPQRLQAAGVKFCISGAGRFGASNVRNLPYHAATAAAYGLSEEDALKSITLYPAEILGVADRVGSLEVGKQATLIVTDGDPLETPTQTEAAFIQGRRVELLDRHKRLWRKYQEKYRRLEAVGGKGEGDD
ncbi:MAG: amidohydrolase family protein [Pirellulaceae bacterium]